MVYATVIKRPTIVAVPFPALVMKDIAASVMKHVKFRIQQGVDAYDNPAPPLKKKPNPKYKSYGDYKVMFGGQDKRDWTRPAGMWQVYKDRRKVLSISDRYAIGVTMRTMGVLEASVNTAKIGFWSPVAKQRAYFNNMRHWQFGMSPSDHAMFKISVELKAKDYIRVLQSNLAQSGVAGVRRAG